MRAGAVLLALVAVAAASDPDEQVLRSHGIRPDTDGIRTLLRSLAPDDIVLARARGAVAALASPHAARRRRASGRLQALGAAAVPALAAAAASEDPEVARRVRELLAPANALRDTLAAAAFRVIAARRLKGLADDVLAARAVLRECCGRLAAEEALVATVRPEDAATLRRLVAAGDADERPLAVVGYAAAAGEASRPDLRRWLFDERIPIRLAAAWALADLGDAACLCAFVELLDADQLDVRLGAVNGLRQVSGQQFGYDALCGSGARRAGVLAWSDWVSDHAATARWTRPVPREARFLGRVLVTQFSTGRVVELDLEGRKLWEAEVQHVWACGGTPGGHRLVGQVNEHRVVEFDAAGRQVRTFQGLPGFAYSVRRQPNGNTLVSVAAPGNVPASRLIELDRDGRPVWKRDLEGFPADAERLGNGRTLVALYLRNRVVEIDPAGHVLWGIDVDGPYSAQRLDNGNTLVCEARAKQVVEVTRAGRVVWRHIVSNGCSGARRLPDGRTLVTTGGGVLLVRRDGFETWLLRGKGPFRASLH